jgi:hypothetical protein
MSDDNDNSSLESLLRSTPLREPSEHLDARVDAVFATYRFRSAERGRAPFLRLAVAAALLIAVGIGIRMSIPNGNRPVAVTQANAAPTTVSAQLHPIRIERDTTTIYDDGVIAGADDSAYQQYRRRTVREIWYIDPSTHAKVVVTIPTEQVMIQKMETF